MKKKILFLTVTVFTVVFGITLQACGKKTTQTDSKKNLPNKAEYESLENCLVGETKLLAKQTAEFAQSDDVLLYSENKELLNTASLFAKEVLQRKEPQSAKRYIVKKSDSDNDFSNGKISYNELVDYCANKYPITINNQNGVNAVATASVLSFCNAYPKPKDFFGTQIIILEYSSDFSFCAVFTETENQTVKCSVTPIFGEIPEDNSFSKIASSGNLGIAFTCDEYECNSNVNCSLQDCEISAKNKHFSNISDNAEKSEITFAQSGMQSVGKRANKEFLKIAECPNAVFEQCLSHKVYEKLTPLYAVIWYENNLSDLYGINKNSVQNKSLLNSKLAQGLASWACNTLANSDLNVVSQSVVKTSTSFLTNENTQPVAVCLLYKKGKNYYAGITSFDYTDNGCVIATSVPLEEQSAVNNIIDFYNNGKKITEYSEQMNGWLMSGKFVKLNSENRNG